MAKTGKSINLFLMDGDANGRIKCTLANWTGLAYKIPRTELEKCKDRNDLKQSGVYFLFGIEEKTGKNVVYVGQAGARKNGEGILYRLMEHKRNPQKDYWTEAIVFTTSNNSFGPTEISYLENRFVNLAVETGRYIVKNENDPNIGNITEEKESELLEFIDYAKLVMGTLGHKVFVPLTKPAAAADEQQDEKKKETMLYLHQKIRKSNREIQAFGKQTAEGFVVLKESQIEAIESPSLPTALHKRRLESTISETGILLEDELFNSPSYASSFVLGMPSNGLTAWKTKDGVTLKEIESGETEVH